MIVFPCISFTSLFISLYIHARLTAVPLFEKNGLLALTRRLFGGLTILGHHRLLAYANFVAMDPHDYYLPIQLSLHNGIQLHVVSIHLPPRLSTAARLEALAALKRDVHGPTGALTILVGDFNDDLPPARSRWLAAELRAAGLLQGFWCPYARPSSTHFWQRHARVTGRTLDWVFLSRHVPCPKAHISLLPGLSSHSALAVDLTLSLPLRPLDCTSPPRYLIGECSDDQLEAAGACLTLHLFWANAAGMSIDDMFMSSWPTLSNIIPHRRPRPPAQPRSTPNPGGPPDDRHAMTLLGTRPSALDAQFQPRFF